MGAVMEIGSNPAKNTFQKPYMSSSGVGSHGRDYGGSAVARREKYYLATLGFFN